LIKNIFIHIGLHKTGSTSIQHALGEAHYALSRKGFLYPLFKKRYLAIYNHSWPVYSLFSDKPMPYHVNFKDGIRSKDQLNQLNYRFRKQFLKQINDFKGDTLIISGEDISALSTAELASFKEFLIQSISSDICFKIIIFCRHPVDHFRSITQERIKNGVLVSANHFESVMFYKHYYKNITARFTNIFGEGNISAVRYEDSIKMTGGPTEMFLRLVDIDENTAFKNKNININASLSAEAVLIHSAINASKILRSKPSLKTKFINELLNKIPGQSFSLNDALNDHLWNVARDDINWFCSKFSLPLYNYNNHEFSLPSKKWQENTIKYLRSIYPILNSQIRSCIKPLIASETADYKEVSVSKDEGIRPLSWHLYKQGRSAVLSVIDTALIFIKTSWSITKEVTGKMPIIIKIKNMFTRF
jgi:hypothetical protein